MPPKAGTQRCGLLCTTSAGERLKSWFDDFKLDLKYQNTSSSTFTLTPASHDSGFSRLTGLDWNFPKPKIENHMLEKKISFTFKPIRANQVAQTGIRHSADTLLAIDAARHWYLFECTKIQCFPNVSHRYCLYTEKLWMTNYILVRSASAKHLLVSQPQLYFNIDLIFISNQKSPSVQQLSPHTPMSVWLCWSSSLQLESLHRRLQ